MRLIVLTGFALLLLVGCQVEISETAENESGKIIESKQTVQNQEWQPYSFAPTNRLTLNKEVIIGSNEFTINLPDSQCLYYAFGTGESMMPVSGTDGALYVLDRCIKKSDLQVGDMVEAYHSYSFVHQIANISEDRSKVILKGINNAPGTIQTIPMEEVRGAVIAIVYAHR